MRLPPVYPAALAAAYVLAVYASGSAPPSDLVRPLLVTIGATVLVQLLATILLRDRDRGAMAAALLIAAIPIEPVVFVALVALLALMIIPRRIVLARRGPARPVQWESATRLLNVIAVLVLAISAGQLFVDSRLETSRAIAEPLRPVNPNAPDIYVILLDGHPRWDTLESKYGYDSEPFFAAMGTLGFEVARESRSNYNMTGLTFSSMFQMRHLRDIPELAGAFVGDIDAKKTNLLLSDAILQAPGFDQLHRSGYKVVGISSEFTQDSIPADQTVDTGQINDFEIGLLMESRLRTLAPDAMRGAIAGQHRDRIHTSLKRLSALAEERAIGPRFVFAHIVSPHSPPVFGPGGLPRDGWPCFPAFCSFWVTGEPDGRQAEVDAMRDQVAYIDGLALETVRSIVATSARPPVIVVMSDHGGRNDLSDRAEMLRSFFVARTPGHPGLLPIDMTPVNLLPRLLNAYVGDTLPFAPETSYWTDLEETSSRGILDLVPIDPTVPAD